MKLIGMLDSPFVRRVAISLKYMGVSFEHVSLSVFRQFDAFHSINPLVKAPTLICDDGTVLVDSTLMLDYIEQLVPQERRLMPVDLPKRLRCLQLIGQALVASEKSVQYYYETELRPADKRFDTWTQRVHSQLVVAYDLLESAAGAAKPWLLGESFSQADITLSVAWCFTQYIAPGLVDPTRYPAITALSARCEALSEFAMTPLE